MREIVEEGGRDAHTFRFDVAIRGRGGVLTREKTTSCCNFDGAIKSEREMEITAALKQL